MIYLDHASHRPIDPLVAQFLRGMLLTPYGNASSVHHASGRRARDLVDTARVHVAALFGAPSQAVNFTSGATESNNQALLGFAEKPRHGERIRLVTTSVEHASVRHPCRWLEQQGRADVAYVPVDSRGKVDLDALQQSISTGADLLSVLWVNNETGAIQDLPTIAAIAKAKGVPLHVDASQAVGRIDTTSAWNHCDLISVSSHKIGGPEGVGALVVREGISLQPLMHGGSQTVWRPGSQATSLIATLGRTAEIRKQRLREEIAWLTELTQIARERLAERATIISPSDAAPGIVCCGFDGLEFDTILAALSDEVALSSGSACQSGEIGTSHVLRAMQIPTETAMGAIRISLSPLTQKAELAQGIDRLLDITGELRDLAPQSCRNQFLVGAVQ